MERVPIRFGTLRTTVKPSSHSTAVSLLSKGGEIYVSTLQHSLVGNPYCSVNCYRSHGEGCTEQFFESHVRSDMLLASNSRGDDDKKQQKSIQELLERVKEFQEEQQQVDDEEALMQRMEELALLDKAGDLTLESLTPEERKKFLGEVADGRLGKLIQLWSPWWLMPERKYLNETSAKRRQLILEDIGGSSEEDTDTEVTLEPSVLYPVKLFTNSEAKKMPDTMPGGGQPSPYLRFHLVEVLFSYALVLRAFNGDYAQDVTEASVLLLDLCRVLSEDARYESLEHVCLACLEKRSSEGSAANALAIQDVQQILRTNVFLLDALSDTRAMLERYEHDLKLGSESDKRTRKATKAVVKKLALIQKKLAFYQIWVYLVPTEEFQMLAADVEAYLKDNELRG